MKFDFNLTGIAQAHNDECVVLFLLGLEVGNLERLALDTILEEVLVAHLCVTCLEVEQGVG